MAPAQAGGVSITSYGHSALLIKGRAVRAGQSLQGRWLRQGADEPRVSATVILASSELLDEGHASPTAPSWSNPAPIGLGAEIEGFAAPMTASAAAVMASPPCGAGNKKA